MICTMKIVIVQANKCADHIKFTTNELNQDTEQLETKNQI